MTSDNEEDALLGLIPFASDWHAEANYLQVRYLTALYSLPEYTMYFAEESSDIESVLITFTRSCSNAST